MHEFYNRAIVRLLCVIALSLLVVYFFFDKAFIHTPLLPLEKSPFKLAVKPALDHHLGGRSSVSVTETRSAFQFTFKVMPGIDHPYAAGELWFVDRDGKPALADLSKYTTLSFFVQCAPANTLTLTIPTFDPRISKPGDILSYRTVWAYVPCNAKGSIANVDITRLETPQWWYEMFKVDLLRHDYKLDQVPKIAFGSSDKSLREVDSQVELADMELRGTDYRYIAGVASVLALLWGGFGLWYFRAYSRASLEHMKAQLQKDLPLLAYRQLSIEPHRDKEKAAILQYLASQYANPDISVETTALHTGTNRTKVNEVLKAEFGYTFSGYLNKLRLTEAARLLAEKDSATVAEIAYSVGYANVSYFNKLFKQEYGCTPKASRNVSDA